MSGDFCCCCLGWRDAPKGAVFAVTGFTPLSYSGTPLPRLCTPCSLSGGCCESVSGWLPRKWTVPWALWTYMVLRLLFLFFWYCLGCKRVCADSPQSLPETGGISFWFWFFVCSFFQKGAVIIPCNVAVCVQGSAFFFRGSREVLFQGKRI